ncbi:MAG TPA: hypothetical protein RMH85_30700 [Polyangiaceae bacterium LLY-WYZ-15_(1-7)]|nr:hypothetical protein [Myxococcales bacterium]MAT27140.1 hypothetical protein [Sandaracinus sp.]HJK93056.1 hypothetical protein [Polyangiaceae bacterium LLY-WYZ-15_(1-7)]MBJ72780.1 hypothetical protein [Sandaracinus sp.]HJL05746.1 hypothetical protein [Polyangiaceae bacterium LLY-WYZ-15_(1-7)]
MSAETKTAAEAGEAAEPMGPSLVDRIEASRFLGGEFLIWLWYESERREGAFEIEGFGGVSFWLEEQMTLRAEGAQGATASESALKGAMPSATPEAKEALRQGKRPTKAKARLERGPQSWSFVLNADPLTLSAVKVPGVIKDGTEEQFFERMQLAEELEGMIYALYGEFLALRVDPRWEKELAPALARWVAEDPSA